MLAVSTLSPTVTAIFYTVAVVLFIVGALPLESRGVRLHFVALGLAAAFFPAMWNAWAAT
jgi:hypothetical protein